MVVLKFDKQGKDCPQNGVYYHKNKGYYVIEDLDLRVLF